MECESGKQDKTLCFRIAFRSPVNESTEPLRALRDFAVQPSPYFANPRTIISTPSASGRASDRLGRLREIIAKPMPM